MADINKANTEASDLEGIANELDSIMKMITGSKETLKAGWSGTAYTSFVRAADTLLGDAANCKKNINVLASTLRGTAKQLQLANVPKK